jgi:hypothetical protein
MRTLVLLRTDATRPVTGRGMAWTDGIEAFDDSLAHAGVLLASLGPSRDDPVARVRIDDERPSVRRGQPADAIVDLAGLWLWQVRSMDEAIAWARRFPAGAGAHMELEIHPVADRATGTHHTRQED